MAWLDILKSTASNAIDGLSGDLHDVSKAIWSKPELAFEEHSAHDVLCNFLEKQGICLKSLFLHFIYLIYFAKV